MRVAIHASLDFKEHIEKMAETLRKRQFIVLLPDLERYQHIRDELGQEEEFNRIKNRLTRQNIEIVENCDALLVLNYDHRGIKNYIGGNSFLEMVIAFYLNKGIHLLNPVPEGMPYTEEVKALFPNVCGTLQNFVAMVTGGSR